MKKFSLVFSFLFSTVLSFAQITTVEKQIAFDLLKQNQIKLGLTDFDVENTLVSSTYLNNASGIRMVYLNQTFKSIPVFNKMQVLAFKNNVLVSNTGSWINAIDQLVNIASGVPTISATQAVQSVISDLKLSTKELIKPTTEPNGKLNFGQLNISEVDIIAELIWLPISEKNVVLTWQIEIAPIKTVDHFMIRVDAVSGKVLDKNNYTVYEKFNDVEKTNNKHTHSNAEVVSNDQLMSQQSPSVVSSASYRVIPFPAESPLHANGAAALVTDPWNLAGGNATSLQWHFDGTSYHDSTRGNNVWAQEDRDNNNINGKGATSSTAQPNLTFDIAPDYTVAPTTTSFQRFATTNLFYWNNLLHDLTYNYGFDEVSGNFQNNNQGRGGLASDYVVADAQDGGGTNNANFSTPVDGSRPRMQMYLSSFTTPNRDGDLDNGVIAHEYMHGVSNRLTGGPANSSCLSNAEQGGEGWSDYLALMSVTNWATATLNDGVIARPIGTYLFGQAPTGTGIRTYPYSTNMSINPWTYAMMTGSGGAVHKIGEIWCATLWDMTWEMIAMDGINSNIFNNTGIGGNSAALKLVIEGMRLQPCSPGYIDARNAILKADTIFFGAKYSCAIWKAFARRGMGKFASQGSSSSTTDQTADFTVNGGGSFTISQNLTQQEEGLNVTYTHTVNTGNCGAIVNHIIRDTLPSNVTYVSGGNYDSATRVVSFPVTLALGQTENYAFTVTINNGTYFTPVLLLDETVPSTTISNVWTPTSTTTTNWTTSTAQKTSAPNSFFTSNLTTVSDQKLETTNALLLPANPPALTFQGYINSESGWDGGVVEISTNNGTTWTDLGASIVSGGYNGSLGTSTNPLSGKLAFNGNSGGFVKTTINLSAYANQSVKFRFRFGSDASVAGTGWYIDDIQFKSIPQINIKGILFNASNIKTATADTITIILAGSNTCIPATISTQPTNISICENANSAIVSVTASGTGIAYQWQTSTDNGVSFSDIDNENNATYNLSNLTTSNNGNQYRCKINGTCTTEFLSASSTLTINTLPASPSTTGASRCGTGTLILSASAGTNETIEWFAASTGGTTIGTGLNYTTPSISASTNYYAQTKNTITGCLSASRALTTANILSVPSAPTGTGASTCVSTSAVLSATTSNGQTINWYSAATGGTLLATNSNTYTTPNLTSTTIYYAEANNGTCVSSTRTAVTATVNALPASVATIANATKCGTDTSTISATALTGMTINWYADSLTTNLLQSGTLTGINKYITPSLSTTTLYWAVQRDLTTGCKSISKRVTTTINPRPASPTVNNGSRCGSGRVTLTAVAPTNPVGTLAWYSTTTGGSSLSTTTSYQTPSISVSTTYYVEAKTTATGCISLSRSPIIASVNAVPAAPVAAPASRCGTGTVTVGATPATGLTVNWYSAATNGTLLLSGSLTYTSPSITSSKTYYAVARNASTTCVSTTRTAVAATVSTTTPTAPTTLSGLLAICPIVGTANGTTYTASTVTGISSYKWSVPTGAVIDSGSTGLKIRVRFITAGTNDSITVQSNNGCLSAKRGIKLTTSGCATTPLAKGNVISSTTANFSVYVFPNPSQNKFSVKANTNSTELIKINILDIQGRILKTISSNATNMIDFGNDLKPGMYLLKIQQGKNTITEKIFKL
jgi:hypothetical protein